KDALFDKSKAVWVRVEYIDKCSDTFQVEYDTDADPVAVANPIRQKFDSKALAQQTFKLIDFSLKGRQDGKSDLRIDDNGDGPEIITRVTVTDEDPDLVHFPKNNPAKPIAIDGKKSEGEWDG